MGEGSNVGYSTIGVYNKKTAHSIYRAIELYS